MPAPTFDSIPLDCAPPPTNKSADSFKFTVSRSRSPKLKSYSTINTYSTNGYHPYCIHTGPHRLINSDSTPYETPIRRIKNENACDSTVERRNQRFSVSPFTNLKKDDCKKNSQGVRGFRRASMGSGELLVGNLVGSYEESLLSGRMSMHPSSPSIPFIAQIGVIGHGKCKHDLRCPGHITVLFPAYFYSLGNEDQSPYVGHVDLGTHIPRQNIGYQLPPRGQLQIVIKNPNKTALKVFLLPYDFSDMPAGTKTFLRQTTATPTGGVCYALHAQFCCTDRRRIYLHKQLRVVFASRVVERRDLRVTCDGPRDPKYTKIAKSEYSVQVAESLKEDRKDENPELSLNMERDELEMGENETDEEEGEENVDCFENDFIL
ncbi:uncharacterized protein VTP21DRAFT_8365 [Calcarisporiella thermophila]|uniref:uncharacterized protein n=1 Tax=Calcarisporiella thermophila TaxID=911321 RepID=UPI0037446011